jgi:uncharacterized HhH-GPD family protein
MMDRFRDEGTLTGDEEADEYLRTEPAAVLLGMLYDQRVLAEYAFTGPIRLRDRLGHLDLARIARMSGDDLREQFGILPAVHRFTNKMADYTRSLAQIVVEDYKGNAENLWSDGISADEVQSRAVKLPGFGKMKAYKLRFALHYFGWRDFS